MKIRREQVEADDQLRVQVEADDQLMFIKWKLMIS